MEKPKIESGKSYEQLARNESIRFLERTDQSAISSHSVLRLHSDRPALSWEPENSVGVDGAEVSMPYALFTNGEQISKAYRSRDEVWKKAEEAGLVVDLPSDEEEKKPKQVLDEGYHIQPCQADQADDRPASASNANSEPFRQKRSSSAR